MGESTKAVSALVMIVASMATVFLWMADRPDAITWAFRIGCPLMALFALALILKLHFRADLAPDYLRSLAGNYFNRDGFSFTIVASESNGSCYMDAYFQNQRDRRCVGRIALRPSKGFWMTRPDFDTITYEIECEPAAFGRVSVPIPVPRENQGKPQTFEVGAAVEYPDGKGKLLRFFDGIFIRTNTKFDDRFTTAATILGAAGGTIVLSKPATIKIELPREVSESIPNELTPETETLWKLGDPPLQSS